MLTIDVEDWFHSVGNIDPSQWAACPAHIEYTVDVLLRVLEQHSARATFFMLGWIASRFPRLPSDIVKQRHEIACHGFEHAPLHRLSPNQFREDLRRSKAVIEDACGVSPVGYRAPYWSIREHTRWALDILEDEGFYYDSSMFPARAPVVGVRGMPDACCRPTASGRLLEIPPTTAQLGVFRWPVSNGIFLRWTPAVVIRAVLNHRLAADRPAMVCVHPSEIDAYRPFIPGERWRRAFHMSGIPISQKLNHLLAQYRFLPIVEALAPMLPPAGGRLPKQIGKGYIEAYR